MIDLAKISKKLDSLDQNIFDELNINNVSEEITQLIFEVSRRQHEVYASLITLLANELNKK